MFQKDNIFGQLQNTCMVNISLATLPPAQLWCGLLPAFNFGSNKKRTKIFHANSGKSPFIQIIVFYKISENFRVWQMCTLLLIAHFLNPIKNPWFKIRIICHPSQLYNLIS